LQVIALYLPKLLVVLKFMFYKLLINQTFLVDSVAGDCTLPPKAPGCPLIDCSMAGTEREFMSKMDSMTAPPRDQAQQQAPVTFLEASHCMRDFWRLNAGTESHQLQPAAGTKNEFTAKPRRVTEWGEC
jgi:hypothetical protein